MMNGYKKIRHILVLIQVLEECLGIFIAQLLVLAFSHWGLSHLHLSYQYLVAYICSKGQYL
jgi:hypothetical protein